ncbi:hypothetical protein A9D60_24050 [Leisingera sp. JC1]|nr:hypothetical protein A9D60_24050 [Leisingera sp. JC1]
MNGQPAMIFLEHELQHMLTEAAKQAAQEVIDNFKSELSTDPNEVVIRKLRKYLADRRSVANPRDQWANGLHIRSIKTNTRGKPRSQSWFQQFKVKSGLNGCFSRKSLSSGGFREWCFEDIANAWEQSQF